MRKYVFLILLFFGCFLFEITIDNSFASASIKHSVDTDPYDSRVITINIDGIYSRVSKLQVHEVVTCQLSEEGCNEYTIDTEKHYFKDINVEEYLVGGNTKASLTYTITSEEDGNKLFFVAAYTDDGIYLPKNSGYFEHKLSTLSQRVILNSDSFGKPTHVYENIQYSAVRKVTIDVNLIEDEKDLFSGIAYICEGNRCTDYFLADGTISYYISSLNDGEKQVDVYLVNKGAVIPDIRDKVPELKNKARLISKKIYLDTIGPKITLERGNWIWLESGETYTPQNATCADSVFKNDACTVTNDLNIIKIDYTSDEYQLITYEASDRLGNIKTEIVKIKVNIEEDNTNLVIYLSIAGGVMALTVVILGYILIKNNEKKKKMSYI